jgi:hypothetical protein
MLANFLGVLPILTPPLRALAFIMCSEGQLKLKRKHTHMHTKEMQFNWHNAWQMEGTQVQQLRWPWLLGCLQSWNELRVELLLACLSWPPFLGNSTLSQPMWPQWSYCIRWALHSLLDQGGPLGYGLRPQEFGERYTLTLAGKEIHMIMLYYIS